MMFKCILIFYMSIKMKKKIFDFRGIKRHYSHGFHGLKLFHVVFKMKFESMQYNLVCEI